MKYRDERILEPIFQESQVGSCIEIVCFYTRRTLEFGLSIILQLVFYCSTKWLGGRVNSNTVFWTNERRFESQSRQK